MVMARSEVMTIRIEESLGAKLNQIAVEVGLSRADLLRFVLRAAADMDSQQLRARLNGSVRSVLENTEFEIGKTSIQANL